MACLQETHDILGVDGLCAVWARQLSKDDEPTHAPQWMPIQR